MLKRRVPAEHQPRPKKPCSSTLVHRSASHSIHETVSALKSCSKILVITGAGVSTSAGIPDFRSSHGLYARHKLRGAFDAATLGYAPDEVRTAISALIEQTSTAEPTPFDMALDSMRHRVVRVYTQNADGLERKVATSSPSTTDCALQVVELHGSLAEMVCTLRPIHRRAHDPQRLWDSCQDCAAEQQGRSERGLRRRGSGIMRPRVTLYQEQAFDDVEIAQSMEQDMQEPPDALIVAGTTLRIQSLYDFAARIARKVNRSGGPTVWVSHGRCPISQMAFQLKTDCDQFAHSLLTLTAEGCDAGQLAGRNDVRSVAVPTSSLQQVQTATETAECVREWSACRA